MVENTTQESIQILFDNFATFLIEKNNRYGDSALYPNHVFSKDSTSNQICTRIE